jgi:hypothetical protein
MISVTTQEVREEAARCSEKAEQALDEEIRRLFLRLRDKWIDIAQKNEARERLS